MNITKTRGDTLKIRFSIKISGEPYEITDNDRIYMTIKKDSAIQKPAFQYSIGDGITYDSATQKYTIVIPSCDTCQVDCDDYFYDIELVRAYDGDRDTSTLVKGIITFTEDITMRVNEG